MIGVIKKIADYDCVYLESPLPIYTQICVTRVKLRVTLLKIAPFVYLRNKVIFSNKVEIRRCHVTRTRIIYK